MWDMRAVSPFPSMSPPPPHPPPPSPSPERTEPPDNPDQHPHGTISTHPAQLDHHLRATSPRTKGSHDLRLPHIAKDDVAMVHERFWLSVRGDIWKGAQSDVLTVTTSKWIIQPVREILCSSPLVRCFLVTARSGPIIQPVRAYSVLPPPPPGGSYLSVTRRSDEPYLCVLNPSRASRSSSRHAREQVEFPRAGSNRTPCFRLPPGPPSPVPRPPRWGVPA